MRISRILFLLFLLLLINIVTVTLSDEKSKLTAVNSTEYYLHFFIDGIEYLYVAPGKSITHATDPKPDIIVTAFYAPGQGIIGSVTDTVDVPYQSASSGCTCDEQGQADCFYNPPTGGATTWEVTSSMIIAELI
jgi:hypothetical protein